MVFIFQFHLKVSDQTLLLNVLLIQCHHQHHHPHHHCHHYHHHYFHHIITSIIVIIIIMIGGEGSVEMAEPGASY